MGTRRNPAAIAVAAMLLLVTTSCGRSNYVVGAPTLALPTQQVTQVATTASVLSKPESSESQGEERTVTGKVIELLPPDNSGNPHELFTIQVNGVQIRVAHNTELAPYVPLKAGASVEIKGEYLPVSPMPVLHWTHHDPKHKHPDGYILFNGRKYQ